MPTWRSIGATAAAATALAAGSVVAAAPAMAAPAWATYSCNYGWGSADVEFDRFDGELFLDADITFGFTAPGPYNTIVTTTFGTSSAPGPSAVIPPGPSPHVTLSGPYATLNAAPAVIHVKFGPAGGPWASVDCTATSPGSGWPV